MSMNKKLLIASISAALSLSIFPETALAKNSFLVAPGRVQFDMAKTESRTFIITNTGDERIRLDIEPVYIPVGENGLKIGTNTDESVADKENISGSIRVSPRALSLAPGERRDIRVQVQANPKAEPGDYRSHLMVRMREASITQNIENNDAATGMNMKLDIKMETAVALYARMGEPSRSQDISLRCSGNEGSKDYLVRIRNDSSFRADSILIIDGTERPYVSLRNTVQSLSLSPGIEGKTISIITNDDPNSVHTTTCK